MLNALELKRLAARGEGPVLEFKRRTPDGPRIAKEIIAFANTCGGKVLIGVDDDGTVIGVKDSAEEEYSVEMALANLCSPRVSYRCVRVPITNKRDVIVVSVPVSRNKPHELVADNRRARGTVYIRVDDMSLEASEESIELMRSESESDGVQFEFGEDELSVMRYLDRYGSISVKQFARLSNRKPRIVRRILVTLARARVLTFHTAAEGDYFTLRFKDSN